MAHFDVRGAAYYVRNCGVNGHDADIVFRANGPETDIDFVWYT